MNCYQTNEPLQEVLVLLSNHHFLSWKTKDIKPFLWSLYQTKTLGRVFAYRHSRLYHSG